MILSTTKLINYIDTTIELSQFSIEIYQIDSNLVGIIRRCIRNIYASLIESEEDNVIVSYLRMELFKLQSSPNLPSSKMLTHCGLDDSERTQKIWGEQVLNECNFLQKALHVLNKNGSPLLNKLVEVVVEKINTCGPDKVKIWCHKKEKDLFTELFSSHNVVLSDKNFICTLYEYKNLELFDILIRIGPLRSQGWSKTPKVVISSPRYKKLIQFVWKSSFNESDFGIDTIINNKNYMDYFQFSEKTIKSHIKIDDVTDVDYEEIDDFNFLSSRPIIKQQESKCILIEFPGEKGVLLAPASTQLIFDSTQNEENFLYHESHEILPSHYLLLYEMEADFKHDSITYVKGPIAFLWKRQLKKLYQYQYTFLISKMRASGIDLKDLDRAAKKWMSHDGEVIHGPQSMQHFKLLITKVLPDSIKKYSWKQAWDEILDSRGKAIHEGRVESENVNEQLLKELNLNIEYVREHSHDDEFFTLSILSGSGISGNVKFYPVINVSEGFNAPHEKIGIIDTISNLELYRVKV